MSYSAGTANSFGALVGALVAACTANGWTLSSAGVLHKGNVYVHVRAATWQSVATALGISVVDNGGVESMYITPGLGINGAGELVDAHPFFCARIGGVCAQREDPSFSSVPFTFPVQYEVHIHSDPDEVYLVVHHDVDHYQHIAFGHNPLAKATGGTGAWASASLPVPLNSGTSLTPSPNELGIITGAEALAASGPATGRTSYPAPAAPCFTVNVIGGTGGWTVQRLEGVSDASKWGITHTIHHGVDGQKWSGGTELQANVSVTAAPKFVRGLSEIDGSAPLIRPVASILRPDRKVSTVAQFEHYRLIRLDHLQSGQVLELGSDRWIVYPFMRRSPDGSYPTGVGGASPKISHTGYLGWAVRYHGA